MPRTRPLELTHPHAPPPPPLAQVHRDLKPENVAVLQRDDGSIWATVLDMGCLVDLRTMSPANFFQLICLDNPDAAMALTGPDGNMAFDSDEGHMWATTPTTDVGQLAFMLLRVLLRDRLPPELQPPTEYDRATFRAYLIRLARALQEIADGYSSYDDIAELLEALAQVDRPCLDRKSVV